MDPADYERQAGEFAQRLAAEGLGEEAAQIRSLLEYRVIWAQLPSAVYSLARRVRPGVSPETQAWCDRMVELSGAYLPLDHERLVYSPIRKLAGDLRAAGQGHWAAGLEEALEGGATGGEIFLGLHHCLRSLLRSDAPLSPRLREDAVSLASLLQRSLREAGLRP